MKTLTKTAGLYRIYWYSGGSSLASVGCMYDGTCWYAPINWTSKNNNRPMVASTDWHEVKKIEKIDVPEDTEDKEETEIKKLLEELHDLYDNARARSKEINTKDTEYNDKIRKVKAGAYADAYSYCIMRLKNLYFTGTVNGSERC